LEDQPAVAQPPGAGRLRNDMFLLGWLRMGIHQLRIWLVVEPYPSEKYELVSWDDEIRSIWKNKIHVPNH